ncbi:MAG: DUF3658 domain-containing protein [Christensenella sp.]|uniref:DUF3658 domain-containing protein n=1 Tax=Christensenella sp. TaxID=1935934 RepID=UPI002B2060FC|nr:DUF3658 domain-containing protein [Christensenella sp.]MEA5002764.1 DUF3658 domain-containing protein [Christensenella sp.]
MLEVVFGDSEKGSMKVGKCRGDGFTIVGYIGGSSDGHPLSQAEMEDMFEGDTPLEGSPSDVVNIGFTLDVGDISGAVDGQGRQAAFDLLWGMHDFSDQDREELFSAQRADLEKLLSVARSGQSVRIWTSNAPYSTCGLYYTCHLLRHIDCDIRVIALPPFMPLENEDATVSYSHWGEVEPGKFSSFLPLEKKLLPCEKRTLAIMWCDLIQENAPLRALVNGHLLSVPETFYDHLILNNAPDGDFRMIWLVGKLLGEYQLGISDSWYVARLRAMIREGRFALVGHADKSHPYGEILRKISR